ncbi:MAG: site-specific DNA-methyltransferase [Spirochaetales bacterium]|nr:site-specific DNA-methyltransferase [Spirochaetales bacterium]
MKEEIARIDGDPELYRILEPLCRLRKGDVWEDPEKGHRVGVFDATDGSDMKKLMGGEAVSLAVCDPPYNIAVGGKSTRSLFQNDLDGYMDFSRKWAAHVVGLLKTDGSFYVWLGADQNNGLKPFPDFVLMMRGFPELAVRSFITVRNQRGYGTQKNWMAVRQELLYYAKGDPPFHVEAEYTDIPKILRGYYKEVNGRVTENLERGKSENIRAGNVWVDVQQVFYRMEENVPGCYAQKTLKAVDRILHASSGEGEAVFDPFAHSGTTLLSAERLGRRCFCSDIDPVFAEITIRRLERYRKTGKLGWQWHTPFPEAKTERREASADLFGEMNESTAHNTIDTYPK